VKKRRRVSKIIK